ncbi:MAG: cation:proton antiporter [Myxococcota bacterium]
MFVIEAATVLLVLASMFGLFNHHVLKLPFTIGLLVSGLLASLAMLGFDGLFPRFELAEQARSALNEVQFADTVLHGLLSILLFAGALHTDLDDLLARARPILSLATIGVLLSTGIAATLGWFVFQGLGVEMPFAWCLVFGAIVSPTDPIAVLGIMRSAGAPKAMEAKVVGESLFNDGIGVVLFLVLVQWAAPGVDGHAAVQPGIASIAKLLAVEVLGGVLLGLAFGGLAYLALRSIDAPNLEILVSVATIMALNLVALRLHASAPLAAVMAGLFLGNRGRTLAMSETTKKNLDVVWHFIDEALNAVLFLLVGLEVFALTFDPRLFAAGLILIPCVLAARAASVVLPLSVLARGEVDRGSRRILIWGGLKGGVSVALAMSLAPFPGRDAILVATYLTVIFSVVVQGLTVGLLIRRLRPL